MENNNLELVVARSDGLYASHGFMAPGVSLFRRLNFPAKSLIVLGVMLIPILVLSLAVYRVSAGGIETAVSEREGLGYVNALNVLLHDVSDLRLTATVKQGEMETLTSNVRTELASLQKLHETLSFPLAEDTTGDFKKLVDTLGILTAKPVLDEPQATFDAYTASIGSGLKLLNDISDDSQLSLDPDLDTYHMQNIVVNVGPQYEEYLAQLSALGQVSAIDSNGKKMPDDRRDRVVHSMTLIEYVDPIYENSYRTGVQSVAEVAKTMDMAGVDSSREAFMKMYQSDLLGNAINADAKAVRSAGTVAYDNQVKINRQIAARLDVQLQGRITHLRNDMLMYYGLAGACLLIAIYFMASFYRVTSGGLNLVSVHLNEMATGDLRHRPGRPLGSDEASRVIEDLRKVYEAMQELIRRVRHSARELAVTSEEVSRASADLSERTEQAASRLGEQGASMAEIGEQTHQSAQNTSQAAVMAQGNAEVAQKGGEIISSVTSTMRDMQASSTRISDIISTIDGIAFQTNILALNAAVEAARAGESGRGFAVVASEVRTLAGRTTAAAKEIKDLITTMVVQVSAGADKVEGASINIMELVSNAKQISLYLDEISGATQQQAVRVVEVVDAITALDSNTQQNAALVEQTSASAESLADQAIKLTREIANFRVA